MTRTGPLLSALDAMAAYKAAVLASDTSALKRIWADDYNFINAHGGIVTRAQRLANFASGATVRVYGDMAVVINLSTLHAGSFSPTSSRPFHETPNDIAAAASRIRGWAGRPERPPGV